MKMMMRGGVSVPRASWALAAAPSLRPRTHAGRSLAGTLGQRIALSPNANAAAKFRSFSADGRDRSAAPSSSPSSSSHSPWLTSLQIAAGTAVSLLALLYLKQKLFPGKPSLTAKAAAAVTASPAKAESAPVQNFDDFESLGSVMVWGDNTLGGAPVAKTVISKPTSVSGLDGRAWRHISLSESCGAAVDDRGDLYCWHSQEGSGATPTPKLALKGKQLVQVVTSEEAMFALSKEGRVYAFPAHVEPSAPVETGNSLLNFALQSDPLPKNCQRFDLPPLEKPGKILKLALGSQKLVALAESGKVYVLDTADVGLGSPSHAEAKKNADKKAPLGSKVVSDPQIPIDTTTISKISEDVKSTMVNISPFRKVYSLKSKVKDIACGENHFLGITEEGKAFGWGSNNWGQLGFSYAPDTLYFDDPVDVPLDLNGAKKVTGIAAGGCVSYFVVEGPESTELYAAGMGNFGQLGNSSFMHMSVRPVKVRLPSLAAFDEASKKLEPIRVKYVVTNGSTTAAVLDSSTGASGANRGTSTKLMGEDVYLWGFNRNGYLLNQKASNSSTPDVGGLLSGREGRLQLAWGPHQRMRLTAGPNLLAAYKVAENGK